MVPVAAAPELHFGQHSETGRASSVDYSGKALNQSRTHCPCRWSPTGGRSARCATRSR